MILLSSVDFAEDSRTLRELGFLARLPKPVRRAELLMWLKRICAPDLLDAQEEGERPSRERLKGRRILLAEDTFVNQEVALGMLEEEGCHVEVAASGRQAVSAYRKQDFDLVLMDCQMPEMDGFEATRQIRRLERGQEGSRRIPIVALTANALEGDRERCLLSGMSDYLPKPFTKSQLVSVIRSQLPGASGPDGRR